MVRSSWHIGSARIITILVIFIFDTLDELCMTKDILIIAFWNHIVNQEHLFGEVEQSPDSLARNYERFISGLRDSIRRSVRGKLQSIYAFDNH